MNLDFVSASLVGDFPYLPDPGSTRSGAMLLQLALKDNTNAPTHSALAKGMHLPEVEALIGHEGHDDPEKYTSNATNTVYVAKIYLN